MTILRNVTEGIHPIQDGGFKPGTLVMHVAKTRTGKSDYYNMMWKQKPFIKIDSALVDGSQWYTVDCNKEVAEWVRGLPNPDVDWYEHIDQDWMLHKNKFDVSERVYLQIGLKWT